MGFNINKNVWEIRKMKKILKVITIVLLAINIGTTYAITAQAATTGTTSVTSEVTAGEIGITASDTLTFKSLTYTGATLTIDSTGNETVTVSDARGSFAGWGVTVRQSQVGNQKWDAGMALTLKDTADNNVVISTTSANAFSQSSTDDNYAVIQSTTYSGSIVIPASVKAGTYATTLTWTLGATPTI